MDAWIALLRALRWHWYELYESTLIASTWD